MSKVPDSPPPLPGQTSGNLSDVSHSETEKEAKRLGFLRRLLWSPPRPSENWAQTLVRVTGNLLRWVITVPFVVTLLSLAAVFSYAWWQDRPAYVSEVEGISIGMTPAQVNYQKGEPAGRADPEMEDGVWTQFYRYNGYGGPTWVFFEGKTKESLFVWRICKLDPKSWYEIIGVAGGDSEKSVIRHLGQPSEESFIESGLKKRAHFNRYNLTIIFEKARVETICVGTSS